MTDWPARLSRQDVAWFFGVDVRTVTRWVRQGKVPSHVDSAGWRWFDRDALERIANA